MTVSYTGDVANASGFGPFAQVLFKWKGSVYKLIFKEMIVYLLLYFILNGFYRAVLTQEGWEVYRYAFESLKAYCSIEISAIPLTFVLGFYVNMIVTRWWDQYVLLPWPDSIAMFIVGLMKGTDDRGRLMRRNFIRYIMLSYVITLRKISFRVRKRFPTLDHLIELGILQPEELKTMDMLNEKAQVKKWWMPLVWATQIVEKARSENRINNDPGVQTILNELSNIRKALTKLQHYDHISVPLVYTQVATLAVYFYFLAALMGAQWVYPGDGDNYETIYNLPLFPTPINDTYYGGSTDGTSNVPYYKLDFYYPLFLTLQFAFYVGWLKVAETLINPFGEDDDDFDLNYLIDRHIQVAYMIVDDMFTNHTPELVKDIHWADTVPTILPYTEETVHYRKEEPMGGAEKNVDPENNDENYVSLIYKYPLFHMKSSAQNGISPLLNGKASTPGMAKENYYHGTVSPEASNHFNEIFMNERNYNLIEDPQSDYEAIDTSLFGWWKAKLRKSQIRKSLRSTASYRHAVARGSQRWPQSVAISRLPSRKSTKSLRSQMSTYSKIFHRGSQPIPSIYNRKRSISVSGLASSGPDKSFIINELNQSANLSMSVPDVGSNNNGKTKEPAVLMVEPYLQDYSDENTFSKEDEKGFKESETEEDKNESSANEDSIPNGSLAHMHSYLSTIIEGNSPYGTEYGGSRKSTYYPPTASSVFNQLSPNIQPATIPESNKSPSAVSRYSNLNSNPGDYYPLGSEASNRPTTPRFTIEEVSSANYEPILVTSSPARNSPIPPVSSPPLNTSPTPPVSQAPITPNLPDSVSSQIKEESRRDRQPSDSPILPKRQARMALNAITNRRKGGLPSIPAFRQNSKTEGESSTMKDPVGDNAALLHSDVQHLASPEATHSPKLPPPNKRKTSILKDGVGNTKSGDKNVFINEITNIKHHYDPLEKVRADVKKLEQAKKTIEIEKTNKKDEEKPLEENAVKDVSSAIDIKVTPPTRQNTMKDILQPETETTHALNLDTKDKKQGDEERKSKLQNNKEENSNLEDLSGSCELLDKDAYGDVTPEEEIDIDCDETIPVFTIVKENSEDNSKTPVIDETAPPQDAISNNTENMKNCDTDDISTEIGRTNSTYMTDETEQIEASNPSHSESMKINVEKEKSGEDILDLSPSILNSENANSAFEISTFYV